MNPLTESHLGAVLDGLLADLDRHASEAQTNLPADNPGTGELYQRRAPRYRFRCNCLVRFFASASMDIGALPGRTRNLSRGGMGLLIQRPFAPGEVIEVELSKCPAHGPAFLAGEVRFCRYTGRGYYEVGVAFKAASDEAIFSRSPACAMTAFDWIRNAKFPGQ